MTCLICEGKVGVEYCLSEADSVIRRRKCRECGYVFYTSELEDPMAQDIFNTLRREQLKVLRNAKRKEIRE